jgi:GNAT superfamily N-acetyltransferase
MTDDDTAALEQIEAEAFAGLFPGHSFPIGRAVGVAYPLPGVLMLNRVMALGVHEPATDADLDEIADRFGEREHMVSLSPGAEPADLAEQLRERGYRPGYAWVKFRRAAIAPSPVATDLRLEMIGPARARDFARIVTEGYGMPPEAGEPLAAVVGTPGWACFLALDGDQPAAAGLVHMHGQTAWLGVAATLPEFRRRGGQGAIMVERIRCAMQHGCRRIVTETGDTAPGRPSASYRNILRYGFEPAYVRPNFVSPEPTSAA